MSEAMTETVKTIEREARSPEEKRRELYFDQKTLLDIFLAHGAITRAQYEKSLGDLTEKMGMQEYKND